MLGEIAAVDVGALEFETLDGPALTNLVVAFGQVQAKLEAAQLHALAVWDAREVWKQDGARSGAAWLSKHTAIAASTAREKLRVARQLTEMPETTEALDDGELTYTQARELSKAASDEETSEAFARDEEKLVDEVKHQNADEAGKAVDQWRNQTVPQSAEKVAARRRRRRAVRLWTDVEGMGQLHASTTPEVTAKARRCLNELVDRDWADARARDRRSDAAASLPTDERTYPQRLADAFEHMVDRAMSTIGRESEFPAPIPQVFVNLDYQVLLGKAGRAEELGSGVPLTGEEARRLACDAGISRHITKGESLVLDKGRSVRCATPTQRQAVSPGTEVVPIPCVTLRPSGAGSTTSRSGCGTSDPRM